MNFTNNWRDLVKGRVRRIWATAFAVSLLTTAAQAQTMSGTYTVCPSGCDYSSIGAAVTDLQTNGVGGATTIEISPGDYNEYVSLSGISGLSSSNTLTFKGMGSIPTETHVYAMNSYVIELNSISYVTLQNLHLDQQDWNDYNVTVDFYYASNCTITNCQLSNSTDQNYHYNSCPIKVQYSQDLLVEKCVLRGGGEYGINEGDYNSGNARNVYRNNHISQFYNNGIQAYYGDGNEYINNYIDSAQSGYGTGIYSGDEVTATYDGNTITGVGMSEGFGVGGGGQITLTNNMISVSDNGWSALSIYPYSSSAVFTFLHNSVNLDGTNAWTVVSLSNYDKAMIDFRNNIITRNSSSGYLLDHSGWAPGNRFEGNDWYRSGTGNIITFDGKQYSTFTDYTDALKKLGTGMYEQNMAVTYQGATDLHLDQSTLAPFGAYAGVAKDIDGNTRCTTFPTSGADESSYASNPNHKKPSGTKFTGPTRAYIGHPTVYFNSAAPGTLANYRWYVNGVYESDSIHLHTTSLTYPSSKVKLVMFNCGGADSFETTITVDSPTTVPTSDFISDVSVIRQGEVVQFNDLSTGFPSQWLWEITPESGLLNGNPTKTFKYIYGDKKSDLTKVRFDVPGKYKVCLTTANARGAGNQECKVDYIEVLPSHTLRRGVETLTSAEGYIYDNGGPDGNTLYQYGGDKPLPSAVIDACADSIYLVFKMFDMTCGEGYVRVFEGKNANGKPLHPCTSNTQFGNGPGLTNDNCTYGCSPLTATHTDTFKAARTMYIEMEENNWPGGGAGFEAYYWTKPRTQKPPVASFTSVDSICTNGQVIFTNTSKGDDVIYLWDLDDDLSYFEATTKNTNWPYFAPGSYTITLIAINCGGADTFQKVIRVFNPATPVTSFTVDNPTPTTSDVVFFSKDMPMCVDEYEWTITSASGVGKATFVNGTRETSPTPQVMFSDTGCYDVKLYTKNNSGDDVLKLDCFIKVRESYCVPTVQNKATDIGIAQVKFHTINNTSSQGVTPYTNYTATPSLSTTVEWGVTYDLTVSRTTNKNKITRTAWIDWNEDGDFLDAGEKLGEQTNSTTLSWTIPVKVPVTAKVGATILRIAVNQGSQANTPCGPNVFGEFEDYRVYVRPDGTPPVITLNGADTVKLEQGYSYTDAGATAYDNLDGNITSKMTTKSEPTFDNLTPATYIFKYNVKDAAGNQAVEVRRVVIVGVDKTGPHLIVPGSDTTYLEVNTTYTQDDAVLAEDLVDGDLLSEVKKTNNVNTAVIGTYEAVYTVSDVLGNTTTIKRVVIVQDKTAPTMTLNGLASITLEVGTPYTDAGVAVGDNYYSDSELVKVLVVQNNLDPNKLGTYTIVYTLSDPSGNGPVVVTRTITVVDTQAPALALVGADTVYMDVNTKYVEQGIIINDNYNKDITMWDTSGTFYATFPDAFANQVGDHFTVVYNVTDESGNMSTITRVIVVADRMAPVAKLNGEPVVNVCRWSNYVDAGYTVTDNYDKAVELTETKEGSYTVSGTQKIGGYALRYKLTDRAGNVGYTEWRTIIVMEPNTGDCATGINPGNKMDKYVTVYPNPNTGKFTVKLNLPASEEVKVTVMNMMGQEITQVASGNMSANTLSVDLSSQASGVYMLNVQTSHGNVTKRIVISK